MNYKDFNDNELIYYIKDNNEEANDILFEKYRPLIEISAKRFIKYAYNSGLDLNDFIQEGMIGLSAAIKSFDETRDITFYTYAKNCIEHKMITLITKNMCEKHKVLNNSVPIEINDDEGFHIIYEGILEDMSYNPEELILKKENEKRLIEKVKTNLTDLESQVFDLKLSGFTYKEISEILDRNTKSIDNAIQRIKSKAKEEISKMKNEEL